MDFFLLLVFLALVAAAIVVRRKVNDPANSFGLWFERTMRPRMARAAKVVAYLTLAVWFLIFAFAPKDERGSVDDLLQSFRKAIGLVETKTPTSPSIPPPFRIPGPEETAEPVPGRP